MASLILLLLKTPGSKFYSEVLHIMHVLTLRRMIKDRGIDALVNECLIGPVLSMGATFIAYACALLAYLYLIFTSPAYNRDGSYTPVVVAFAFLIGLQICKIFTTPLSSGIDTIFVAMAWDPEVLIRAHPDLYHRMVAVYPHVQQAIHA